MNFVSSFLLTTVLLGTAEQPVDFDTDIVPIFTKAGCNAGACHGSARGRGGLKLSLYGSDAALDFDAVVRQTGGRRVNLVDVADSLVLLKPTGQIDHGGGCRLENDGEAARRLTQWIAEGAVRRQRRKLVHFEANPASVAVSQPDETVQLRSFARFDDGSHEEVTRWTVFHANDSAAVEIDDDSAVASVRRSGRHIVLARYLDRVVPVELVLPVSDGPLNLATAPRHNFIDEEVYKTLSTLRIPVSPPADDHTFVRRVYLDFTGRLPRPHDVQTFVNDEHVDKRTQLVEQLLASEEFVDYWTYYFGQLLRIKPPGRGKGRDVSAAETYHSWLRQQIQTNTPFDRMVWSLITAEGDSHKNGPANFHRSVSDARAEAEFASEVFMATRLRCANCHNHPLDRWTQDDYHGLAAIFAGLERGQVVRSRGRGQVTHPRTGAPAALRIPGHSDLNGHDSGRRQFADWLINPDNRFLARAVVNRLWKALLGRGFVEPADDLRPTNVPTHPDLLRRLAADFVAHRFNIRHTLRLIASSAAYQRAADTLPGNASDDEYCSHFLTRPLAAEVLADAISDVTGVWDTYGDNPSGTRAILLYDPGVVSTSLDVLGRCARSESCETSTVAGGGGIARRLHLVNGSLVNGKLSAPGGHLRKLLDSEMSDAQLIDAFFLRSLARFPTASEREIWREEFQQAESHQERQELCEDLVWSLLCCREFVTNH